jgi:L-lactate dehydrogenase complex protein LldG
MSDPAARRAILDAVRSARPPEVAAPDVRSTVRGFPTPVGTPADRFRGALRAAGGIVTDTTSDELPRAMAQAAGTAARVWSTVEGIESTVVPGVAPGVTYRVTAAGRARELEDLDLFICRAVLGVAENGAVWLPMTRRAERAALFLASQVIVVLDLETVVSDFHAAYAILDLGAHPFGVFVAGPSKTADIEQSLVVGAHGPKEFHVILVENRPLSTITS